MSMRQDYYSSRELQEKWGVSRVTIWRMVKRGDLTPTRIGGSVKFHKSEVERVAK